MLIDNPVVSAIIPTRYRPELLIRAIQSVLNQTYIHLEIVVVIDGHDPVTEKALLAVQDARVKILPLSDSVGGSEARNIGAQTSTGEWIAFLDDDDEWMPEKIQAQLNEAKKVVDCYPLVCSQVVARSASKDLIWPLFPPKPPYSEYLIVRNRLSYGEGLMQTSTLMVPRDLFNLIPFSKGLPKHQDWDWVLRCLNRKDVAIVFVAKPLAIWNLESGGPRVSKANRWRDSLNWIRNIGDLATPRAYASFIAFYVAPQAARDGAYREFFPLLREMLVKGSSRPLDLFVYLGVWLQPQTVKQLLHITRQH